MVFEKIKLRIIKGRKLQPFLTAKVLQDHEDRIKALEEDAPTPTPTPTTRTISFTIKSDETTPIEGATVKIGSTTKTTGSAGGCSFNEIADGNVSVEVSATGFVDKTETITVSEDNTSFTITLTAS